MWKVSATDFGDDDLMGDDDLLDEEDLKKPDAESLQSTSLWSLLLLVGGESGGLLFVNGGKRRVMGARLCTG